MPGRKFIAGAHWKYSFPFPSYFFIFPLLRDGGVSGGNLFEKIYHKSCVRFELFFYLKLKKKKKKKNSRKKKESERGTFIRAQFLDGGALLLFFAHLYTYIYLFPSPFIHFFFFSYFGWFIDFQLGRPNQLPSMDTVCYFPFLLH